MKTQTQIEERLSRWYGPVGVEKVLKMNGPELLGELRKLDQRQGSGAAMNAADAIKDLLEVMLSARPTVRINLTKRPIHA